MVKHFLANGRYCGRFELAYRSVRGGIGFSRIWSRGQRCTVLFLLISRRENSVNAGRLILDAMSGIVGDSTRHSGCAFPAKGHCCRDLQIGWP